MDGIGTQGSGSIAVNVTAGNAFVSQIRDLESSTTYDLYCALGEIVSAGVRFTTARGRIVVSTDRAHPFLPGQTVALHGHGDEVYMHRLEVDTVEGVGMFTGLDFVNQKFDD